MKFLTWVIRIYANTIRTAPIVPMELLISLVSVVWGLWLLNPLGHTFPNGTIYRGMALMAPEWLWGLVMIGLGLCHLYSLYRSSVKWRARIAISGWLIWGFISISFALSNIWSTATPIYGIFAGCSLIVARRLHKEIDRYDS